MAIAEMNAFTLLTFEAHRGRLLRELQKFGGAQFRPAAEDDLAEMTAPRGPVSGENMSACEGEIAKIKTALDRIKPYCDPPKGLKAMVTPPPVLSYETFSTYIEQYDYQSVCEEIRVRAEQLAALASERNRLAAERDALLGWSGLDVPTPALDGLKTVKYTLGTVHKTSEKQFLSDFAGRFPASYAECEGHTREEACILCLIHADDFEAAAGFLKDNGFSRVPTAFSDTPAKLLEAGRAAADGAAVRESDMRESLAAYAGEYDKLRIALDVLQSELRRHRAAEHFQCLSRVIVAHGWVPADSAAEFESCLARACGDEYCLERQPVERSGGDAPIQLKNNKLVAAFEGITSMYSLPRYHEMDPTPLFTPFYLLFFGIMIGDAGYGLLLFLGTLFALNRLHLKPGARQFMRFLFYLSFSVMVMGLLFGSAFGVTVFTPLRTPGGAPKAVIDTGYDIVLMIVLSVAIGVAHVLFGIAVKGYALLRQGKILDAVFDSLFWILALVSGILLIVGAAGLTPPAVGTVSMWVFIGSLAGLMATQGRGNATLGGKLAGGLFEVYGLTGYVGDLVSYTRLVALSLSSAYIAYSFNLMAGQIPGPVPRIILGGLIVIVGQSMNLGLAILGGYVHSCRLQYVEFFGKFYGGGGRPFTPLALDSDFVEIRESSD